MAETAVHPDGVMDGMTGMRISHLDAVNPELQIRETPEY